MKTEKTQSKKIKDWYKNLKQPIKNQAITNLKLSCKNIKVDNLSDAIMLGFDWKSSKEGFEYWDNVYESLENNEEV